MTNKNSKSAKLKRRHKRVRSRVKGTASRPRLSVFRSNKFIYAQLIDDDNGHSVVGSAETDLKNIKGTKTERARALGKLIAERAKDAGVKNIVFDKGGYKYHGRTKALAEGAREGGLKF